MLILSLALPQCLFPRSALSTVTQRESPLAKCGLCTRGGSPLDTHTAERSSHLYRPLQAGPFHPAYLPEVSEIQAPGNCGSGCAWPACTAQKED